MLSNKAIVCRLYSGILVVIWILAPYAILQHVEIREVLWMPQTAIDKAIPVCFSAVWVYFSFYLLLAIVGLTVEKKYFIRYLYTIGWATAVCHAFFLFLPNGAERSEIPAGAGNWLYQWLIAVDKPRNAMPSLHATLSVIAAIAVQKSALFKPALKVVTWLWVVAIFWSTIALRQHVVIDLAVASVIAPLAWFFVGRSAEMKYHGV